MNTSAKEQAIQDIKKELSLQGKSFLAFHEELNPVIDELVNNRIKEQELCQNSK